MAEYVEREDMSKHLNILYNRLRGKSPHFDCGFLTAVDYVNEFSTSDVVPVVRCKNCMNGIISDDNKYIICCRLGVGMNFDDFCSYSERKNEGDGYAAD